MSRSQVPFEESIATALGALYERKARGTTLIRVLEDYRRFKACKSPSRSCKPACNGAAALPNAQLEQLYLRRAAVDQLIRSMEAYSTLPPVQAHR